MNIIGHVKHSVEIGNRVENATQGKSTINTLRVRIPVLFIVCIGYLKMGDLVAANTYRVKLLNLLELPYLDEDGKVFVEKLCLNIRAWFELEMNLPEKAEKTLSELLDILL